MRWVGRHAEARRDATGEHAEAWRATGWAISGRGTGEMYRPGGG